MRQAGFLAAAGIYALNNNIARLKEDHARAQILAETLQSLPWVIDVMPQHTNIVIFSLPSHELLKKLVNHLEERSIKVSPFGPAQVRLVTHLDFDDTMLEDTVQALREFKA